MHYFLSKIKHLFSATNQHGVHSPFIYNYVTKCLYNKQTLNKNNSKNVLAKTTAYFNCNEIVLLNKGKNINTAPFDLVFGNTNEFNNDLNLILENSTTTSIFIVSDIYKTKEATLFWCSLKEHTKVTVTVDLFYCGVVFFRTAQAKEHFKIRL